MSTTFDHFLTILLTIVENLTIFTSKRGIFTYFLRKSQSGQILLTKKEEIT